MKLVGGLFITYFSWIGVKVFKTGEFLNIQIQDGSTASVGLQVIALLVMLYGLYKVYSVIIRAFKAYQEKHRDLILKR